MEREREVDMERSIPREKDRASKREGVRESERKR